MTTMMVLERGRNDRRDGRKEPDVMGYDNRGMYLRGWELQDAIFKSDRAYAYKLGRSDAKEGNNISPYPVGTNAYNEYMRGQSDYRAAQEQKAEKEQA